MGFTQEKQVKNWMIGGLGDLFRILNFLFV
jgi:hypothetical protein